jgi:hypothetical protein
MEQTNSGEEEYELSLIGILLTKDGKHYEELRIRLLGFLSAKYYNPKKEERRNRYSDEEIAEELKLNENDRKMLGRVGAFDHIYRTSGSSTVGGHWSIDFPRKEIQFIPRKGPFAEYHRKTVFQQYYSDWKVLIEDRHAAQPVTTIPKGIFAEAFASHSPSDSLSSSAKSEVMPSLSVPDVSFVNDEKLRRFATDTAQEASRCFGVKAFTATAVLAGSAIEAVLLDLLLQNKHNLPVPKNNPVEKMQLGDLIMTALKMNLLGKEAGNLSQFVQQHRNLIHPGRCLREKRILDMGDAHIVWGIFVKVCSELNSSGSANTSSAQLHKT